MRRIHTTQYFIRRDAMDSVGISRTINLPKIANFNSM